MLCFHRKTSHWIPQLASLGILTCLVGCDKLPSVLASLKQAKAKPPDTPQVAASFSQAQIANIGAAEHAGFISRPNALVVVDFYADWCPPCRMLTPVLEKAAGKHPGVVFVGKVNVDQAPDLASAQGVRGIPDVRIYKNGREVDRFTGFPGESQVLEKIASLAAGINPGTTPAPAVNTPSEPVIQPFQKDWMPPGMSRKTSTAP